MSISTEYAQALNAVRNAVADLAVSVDQFRANAVTRDDVENIVGDMLAAQARVDAAAPRRSLSAPESPRRGRAGVAVLSPRDSFADWYRATDGDPMARSAAEGDYSLGRIVAALVGQMPMSELTKIEATSLTEGTNAAGGYLVPEPLAPQVIDNIRARARTIEAGVQTVPMDTDTLAIARITGPSSPAWRGELDAMTPSTQSFDRVNFKAKMAATLVRLSMELFDDLSSAGLGVIENEIMAQLGLALDYGVLAGSGAAAEPTGIRNQAGINTISLGANGATPANYDFLVDALGAVRDANGEPNAAIYASRTQTTLDKLKDTTDQPLRPPESVQALTRLTSNQVPVDLTVGTSADCSEAYVGEWSTVLLGMRRQLGLRVLHERFVDTGEIGLLAYFRADVQLAHPEWMTLVTGIRP